MTLPLVSFSLLAREGSATKTASLVSVESTVIHTEKVAQSLYLTGKLRAQQSVSIAPEVAAKVTSIAVHAEQRVVKGQLLVQLNKQKAEALLAEANAYFHDQKRVLNEYQSLIEKQAITQTQLNGQSALVDIAIARLSAAQEEVNRHTINAPFTGTVGLIDFSEGKMLAVGESVLTLDNLSEMTVDLAVPERYLSMLAHGMNVNATSKAWPGVNFVGEVLAIDPRINAKTLNLRVRVLFDNKHQQLKPGMMISAHLVFDARDELVIPVQALEYSGTKRFVYVLTETDLVERTEVLLGSRFQDQVVIESGLQAGDRIVVQGLVNMRHGLKVNDLTRASEQKTDKGAQ